MHMRHVTCTCTCTCKCKYREQCVHTQHMHMTCTAGGSGGRGLVGLGGAAGLLAGAPRLREPLRHRNPTNPPPLVPSHPPSRSAARSLMRAPPLPPPPPLFLFLPIPGDCRARPGVDYSGEGAGWCDGNLPYSVLSVRGAGSGCVRARGTGPRGKCFAKKTPEAEHDSRRVLGRRTRGVGNTSDTWFFALYNILACSTTDPAPIWSTL